MQNGRKIELSVLRRRRLLFDEGLAECRDLDEFGLDAPPQLIKIRKAEGAQHQRTGGERGGGGGRRQPA
jgi:hypothetical protein